MVKTVWVNKITGKAYGENKQEAIESIMFSMSKDEKIALIKKEYSFEDIILEYLNYGRRFFIDDIIKSLIERYCLEAKEVKFKYKWIDNETGEEFFSKEELYKNIQKYYLDDKDFICELIDENYTPSQVYEVIEKKGIEKFGKEVKEKLQEEVVKRWFTYVEVEDE